MKNQGTDDYLLTKEVNEFELPDEEILSDHAYYYSRKSNLVLA